MCRAPAECNYIRGFTLLELLVAMAVMVLLMTASFGAVRLGNRVLESGIEAASDTDRTRTVANLLRRQFAQVVPVVHMVDGESVAAFSADSTAVRFIAPALQSDFNGGLFLYLLRTRQNYDGATLEMAYAPYNPGDPTFGVREWREYTLFDNEEGFEFAYFGSEEPGGPAWWHDDWRSDRQALPELVRISATPPSMRTGWSALIFSVRADYRE